MFPCVGCGVRFRNPSHLQRHLQGNAELHRRLKTKQQEPDRQILETRLRAQQLHVGQSPDDRIKVGDEEDMHAEELSTLRLRQDFTQQKDFIEKTAVCDEFTHACMFTWLQLQKIIVYIETEVKLKIQDIQRPKDLIKAFRYITKKDLQHPIKICDYDVAAHLYAQNHKIIIWGHDIPASIAPVTEHCSPTLCRMNIVVGRRKI